jgi:hypothetical protein
MSEALAMVTMRGELDRAVAGRFLRDAFIEMRPQAECYVWVGWQSAIAMLGMNDLKLLVKKPSTGDSLMATLLCSNISRRISDRGSSTLVNHGIRVIATTRFSAIPSKSYPDGTALASNTGGPGLEPGLVEPEPCAECTRLSIVVVNVELAMPRVTEILMSHLATNGVGWN